jgi:hypothetical protein
MPVQGLTSIDPQQFFNFRPRSDGEIHRLETHVSGLAVSNDFSGRLSVTTAEGDRITLTADLATGFRSGSYESRAETDRTAENVGATYGHSTLQQDFGIAVEGELDKQELHDLDMLFQKVSSIFRGFFQGQDEAARANTAELAELFRGLDRLSSLDLRVEAVRSVAVAAASSVTPGGAPATVAAIPQPSTGTTAPTPSSGSPDDTHLTIPVKDGQLAALIQQVLDALKGAKVEADRLRKHLPDFLEKLREDLLKEFQGLRDLKADDRDYSVAQASDEVSVPTSNTGLLVAYRAVTQTSISLSIQS